MSCEQPTQVTTVICTTVIRWFPPQVHFPAFPWLWPSNIQMRQESALCLFWCSPPGLQQRHSPTHLSLHPLLATTCVAEPAPLALLVCGPPSVQYVSLKPVNLINLVFLSSSWVPSWYHTQVIIITHNKDTKIQTMKWIERGKQRGQGKPLISSSPEACPSGLTLGRKAPPVTLHPGAVLKLCLLQIYLLKRVLPSSLTSSSCPP